MKFRSPMTRFALAGEKEELFQQALDRYCVGAQDPATLNPSGSGRRANGAWPTFHSQTVLPTVLIDVRMSDVAMPAAGGTVEVAFDFFDIKPTSDSLGLVWSCEATQVG